MKQPTDTIIDRHGASSEQLIPILQENLKDYTNLVLLNDDILKVDLDELLQKEGDGRKVTTTTPSLPPATAGRRRNAQFRALEKDAAGPSEIKRQRLGQPRQEKVAEPQMRAEGGWLRAAAPSDESGRRDVKRLAILKTGLAQRRSRADDWRQRLFVWLQLGQRKCLAH